VAAEQDPDSTEITINLGVAWLEQEDYQAAEQTFRRVVRLEPDNFQAQQNLAAALRRQQRYEESLATMQTAAGLIPDPPAQHYYYMGLDAIELARTDQAQAYLSRALSIDPKHEAAGERLAFIHMNAGRYDQALASNPGLPQALDILAYKHYNAGRVEQAMELYRHSVAISPNDANAHSNLGSALAQLGRYQEAIASLERALVLDPQQQTARSNLQRVHQRLNESR
ncbi:MAG: tetratricopeptide repeat protein, partial [Gammaproteobacteria bacterium]